MRGRHPLAAIEGPSARLREEIKNPGPSLKRLVEKGAVIIEEVPLGAEEGGAFAGSDQRCYREE